MDALLSDRRRVGEKRGFGDKNAIVPVGPKKEKSPFVFPKLGKVGCLLPAILPHEDDESHADYERNKRRRLILENQQRGIVSENVSRNIRSTAYITTSQTDLYDELAKAPRGSGLFRHSDVGGHLVGYFKYHECEMIQIKLKDERTGEEIATGDFVRRTKGPGVDLSLWIRPVSIAEEWVSPTADKSTLGDVLTVYTIANVPLDDRQFQDLDHIQAGYFDTLNERLKNVINHRKWDKRCNTSPSERPEGTKTFLALANHNRQAIVKAIRSGENTNMHVQVGRGVFIGGAIRLVLLYVCVFSKRCSYCGRLVARQSHS